MSMVGSFLIIGYLIFFVFLIAIAGVVIYLAIKALRNYNRRCEMELQQHKPKEEKEMKQMKIDDL